RRRAAGHTHRLTGCLARDRRGSRAAPRGGRRLGRDAPSSVLTSWAWGGALARGGLLPARARLLREHLSAVPLDLARGEVVHVACEVADTHDHEAQTDDGEDPAGPGHQPPLRVPAPDEELEVAFHGGLPYDHPDRDEPDAPHERARRRCGLEPPATS